MEPSNIPPNASLVPPSRTGGAFPREPQATAPEGNVPFVQPMRTMKSDMARAIEEKNESLVSIALAEERKKAAQLAAERVKEKEKASLDNTSSVAPRPHGRFFLVVVLMILFGAVGALGVVVVRVLPTLKIQLPDISLPDFGRPDDTVGGTEPTPGSVPVVLVPSLVPAQAEKKIDITGKSPENIFAEIASEHTLTVEKGMVKNIYFTEEVQGEEGMMIPQTITSQRLLELLESRVPEILTRSLEDDVMVGLLGEEAGVTPFLVLKVSTYDGGMAGVLLWEKKLSSLFERVVGAGEPTSSTSQTVFRDVVIGGRDVRTVEVGSTKGVSYAFADATTLIIAGSRSALEELLTRYGGHAQ